MSDMEPHNIGLEVYVYFFVKLPSSVQEPETDFVVPSVVYPPQPIHGVASFGSLDGFNGG